MLDNYAQNDDGLIYQVNREPITYDQDYVNARYNTYGELNQKMSYLRVGGLVSAIGFIPQSVLDVGYGNGAFLKACKECGIKTYGYDVSGYPLTDGEFVEDWLNADVDVVTFFDVLEHFEDPYILKDVKAPIIMVSMPWCHYSPMANNDEWFEAWKHRRPNEHLWHFNHTSLFMFARSIGRRMHTFNNMEDVIRKGPDQRQNILTAVLVR